MTTPNTADPELVEALIDSLDARHLDVLEPAPEHRFLQIINMRAMADLYITPDHAITWNYRPFAGTPHTPATTTEIILTLLGIPPSTRPAARHPRTTLTETLARAAAEHGLSAQTCQYPGDQTAPATTRITETILANPASPRRGYALAADDGGITWTCHLRHPTAPADGLPPDEIADTIARALTTPPPARTPPPSQPRPKTAPPNRRPRRRATITRRLTTGFALLTLDPSPRLRQTRTSIQQRNFYLEARQLISQAMHEAIQSTRTTRP